MAFFHDQMQRLIELPHPPQRIISLVPSQTELLFDLGLASRIVGCTKFCVHPHLLVEAVSKVGGTKQVRHDKIMELKPDLIIANKEENERSDIEELMKHYPVWISDIATLPEALQMIAKVGELTGTDVEAAMLTQTISRRFECLHRAEDTLKVVYLIWRKPYMAAGSDTFITDMLNRTGLKNAVTAQRYPAISEADLKAINPDVVILSSEPYPFKSQHVDELRRMVPNAKIVLADGEMFSWYGSRLQHAPAYFKELQHQLHIEK